MKDKKLQISILGGPKCKKSELAERRLLEVIKKMKIDADVKRVTKAAMICKYPIKYMPGIVINGELVYSPAGTHTDKKGVILSVPEENGIEEMLKVKITQLNKTSG